MVRSTCIGFKHTGTPFFFKKKKEKKNCLVLPHRCVSRVVFPFLRLIYCLCGLDFFSFIWIIDRHPACYFIKKRVRSKKENYCWHIVLLSWLRKEDWYLTIWVTTDQGSGIPPLFIYTRHFSIFTISNCRYRILDCLSERSNLIGKKPNKHWY